MSYNFKPCDPNQLFLLPPSLDDWLADDHLARFVAEVMDHLDDQGKLARFYAPYRKDGLG